MQKHSCFIFGAGEMTDVLKMPESGDLVIAADGGLRYLEKLGIEADIVIGDFDSLGNTPENEKTVVLPCEKDTTDTYEAIQFGHSKGFSTFHIYGGTGGRLDHTLANIQTISDLSQRGCNVYIYGNGYAMTAVTNVSITLSGKRGGYVSVFSHSEVSTGVTLKGLKYELENAVLENNFPLGVSNEFTDKTAEISVKSGTLLVYYTV